MPWLLARCRSSLFPAWMFEGWKGEGRLGRDAWPAPVLMTLLFLRWSEEGVSRLASTRRAQTDVCWRAAMGLSLRTNVPDEKTLREFEAFLRERHPSSGIHRYLLLHEHIVRLCLDAGVVATDRVWAIDSTPMWCYGAVQDTVRLLGDGTRMVAQRFARASGDKVDQLAASWNAPYILGKSIKGALEIDWRDAESRTTVIRTLVDGAARAVAYVRKHIDQARPKYRKRLLRQCRLLLRVIEQDFEADAEGRLVIAQRVAADRLIA